LLHTIIYLIFFLNYLGELEEVERNSESYVSYPDSSHTAVFPELRVCDIFPGTVLSTVLSFRHGSFSSTLKYLYISIMYAHLESTANFFCRYLALYYESYRNWVRLRRERAKIISSNSIVDAYFSSSFRCRLYHEEEGRKCSLENLFLYPHATFCWQIVSCTVSIYILFKN